MRPLHPLDDDTNAKICPAPSLKALCLLHSPLVSILLESGAFHPVQAMFHAQFTGV